MARARTIVRPWAALLACLAAPAFAQAVVSSPGPEGVSVTVYRDPARAPAQAPNLRWLNGYALVSETRQVVLPAGESELRFEGVASGIIPQSVIMSGFPEDVVERNRDAYLLSPGTLLDRSLGRRVHLRRTSLATGEVREQEALIRSGADGAVVLQTADGFEALRCTGLPETLVYQEIPGGLSPRPTLSVRVRNRAPLTTRITLSYLATNFDWQANYVAHLAADGERVDLFAWLTLASNDDTSFVAASTQAVAGQLNREHVPVDPPLARPIQLSCWPQGSTSDVASLGQGGAPPPPPPHAPPPPMAAAEAIVVTGSRVAMQADQEELGDVKLYRIPEPVTVAANSQKQVALLEREDVRVRIVYRQRLDPGDARAPEPVQRLLVTRNRSAEGLGLPLPAGRLVLFGEGAGRPILLGEGFLVDRAVGDDVEIAIGPATGVFTTIERLTGTRDREEYRLTVTNDQSGPVPFEAELLVGEGTLLGPTRRLSRRHGRPLWTVTVPANGSAALRYRIAERR
ncbi:DUF4139 domain-containing protein [Sphingosinicella sp. CPCC 101087]|uniref:DUF4139 domain-containing protein n=1 Tax=Sphingosinicella sp. CPCC 101087 TaxID=2497754 RepID=UPI00101DB56F|nr:hypothetical protein [Sphingosinicella sp. CPCC 101087]